MQLRQLHLDPVPDLNAIHSACNRTRLAVAGTTFIGLFLLTGVRDDDLTAGEEKQRWMRDHRGVEYVDLVVQGVLLHRQM